MGSHLQGDDCSFLRTTDQQWRPLSVALARVNKLCSRINNWWDCINIWKGEGALLSSVSPRQLDVFYISERRSTRRRAGRLPAGLHHRPPQIQKTWFMKEGGAVEERGWWRLYNTGTKRNHLEAALRGFITRHILCAHSLSLFPSLLSTASFKHRRQMSEVLISNQKHFLLTCCLHTPHKVFRRLCGAFICTPTPSTKLPTSQDAFKPSTLTFRRAKLKQ